jgi:hypothetical protein
MHFNTELKGNAAQEHPVTNAFDANGAPVEAEATAGRRYDPCLRALIAPGAPDALELFAAQKELDEWAGAQALLDGGLK